MVGRISGPRSHRPADKKWRTGGATTPAGPRSVACQWPGDRVVGRHRESPSRAISSHESWNSGRSSEAGRLPPVRPDNPIDPAGRRAALPIFPSSYFDGSDTHTAPSGDV